MPVHVGGGGAVEALGHLCAFHSEEESGLFEEDSRTIPDKVLELLETRKRHSRMSPAISGLGASEPSAVTASSRFHRMYARARSCEGP